MSAQPTMTPQDLNTTSALDEETARAELYGLLAALFYAPPSADLLAQLRVAPTEAPAAGGFLEEPWRVLVGAARQGADADIQAEFNSLFGGVGKPEVMLFGSHYLSGFLNDKPLARLRTDLAAMGLERDESMHETEDHVAYVCEVMRYLIAGEDLGICNLSSQKQFFNDHIRPWIEQLFDAIESHPNIQIYRQVSFLTRSFFQIEGQAFDMI